MTSISIPRDDEGLQRLQLQIRRKSAPPPVERPLPCGPVASTSGRPAPAARSVPSRQRGTERRRSERRQQRIPVILDTRSRHERRSRPRRLNDASNGAGPTAGWDAYA